MTITSSYWTFDKNSFTSLFTRFDMQELYTLCPCLLPNATLFWEFFALTASCGSCWFGWACPQTIFRVIYRDFIETKLLKLRRSVKNKQKEPDYKKNRAKQIIAILIWSVLAFIAAADFMWYFVPPETFFEYLQNPSEHPVMVGFVVGLHYF